MYHKATLDNGTRIVTEDMPGVHSAVIGIWVMTGSRFEEASNHGVSHFLEHMMFKGTTKRSARRIAEELESVGGSLNAFTTKEYTCYYAKVLAEHLDLAIDVLTDMFFNSTLESKDMGKEKNVVLEEIKLYEDSPDETIHDLFAQSVWSGHPLGRAILGTADSIQALSREDVVQYYRNRYCLNKTVIAVAGNIEHQKVVDKLGQYFNQPQNVPAPNPPESRSPVPQAAVEVQEKDVEQVQICIGAPGLSQLDDDIYTLHVLNNVLGGGLSSRLFQEIREERGLAYSVYAYPTVYTDTGLFTIYAGTSPDNVPAVISLMVQELDKLRCEGITQEELKRSKEQLKGSLLLSLENVNNRMSRLGKTELIFGRFISVQELLERMEEVQLEDTLKLAEKLFAPEKFTLTSIGPASGGVKVRETWNRR